jgi:hemoglobin
MKPYAQTNNVTLYEQAGGWNALYRFSDLFYHACLVDSVLQPLFGHEELSHVERFTAFTAETESSGGSDRFTKEMSGFRHLIEFRAALKSHVDFGSHVATQNSNAATEAELHPLREVPKWQW